LAAPNVRFLTVVVFLLWRASTGNTMQDEKERPSTLAAAAAARSVDSEARCCPQATFERSQVVRLVDFARHALPALPLPGQRPSTARCLFLTLFHLLHALSVNPLPFRVQSSHCASQSSTTVFVLISSDSCASSHRTPCAMQM
jgi:hypothetical protein